MRFPFLSLALGSTLVACSGSDFVVASTDAAGDALADTGVADTSLSDTGLSDMGTLDGGGSDGASDVRPDVSVDGGVDAVSPGCATSAECGTTGVCFKTGCGAGIRGECRPVVGATVYGPVCGCDQNTYWNAAHAATLDAAVKHEGPCGDGEFAACLGTTCGSDGVCVYLLASESMCLAPTVKGRCWRMPSSTSCGTAPGPAVQGCASGKCRSTCDAIRSGGYYFPVACTP